MLRARLNHTVQQIVDTTGDGKGKTRISYRTVELKYMLDEETNMEELYNLQNDPQEKINLADRE